MKFKFVLSYNVMLLIICIVLFVGFGSINSAFFDFSYISETVKMIMEIGIMSLPLTILIVMAGIDFSMASTLTLAAAVGGIIAKSTNPLVGMLVTFIMGLLCGGFNGFLIAILRLPPLVTTLATMYLYKGITRGITLGNAKIGTNVSATSIALFLGSGAVLGIPTQAWIFVILALIFNTLLGYTSYGRQLYAIGFNEDAAQFSGINTKLVKFSSYMVAGFIFSIAGLVFMGRFSTIQFDSADSYIMQVITATVLGGVDMSGGRGDIKGTVLGVMIIGLLKSGMNLILLPQTQQKIIIGLILLFTLVISEIIKQRALRVKRVAVV